jgi:tetratricopeptide (TPR) repeat protein
MTTVITLFTLAQFNLTKSQFMKCMNITVLFAMILLAAFQAKGQSPDQLASQAAKAYNSRQYSESIKLYTKIIDGGYESYALYYNLGNAYFRNNDNTEAILFYEKALKLAPNNDDLRHNIEVANSKLIDKVEKVPELFYKRWWKEIINLMNIDMLATINILLLTIALILIGLYIAVYNTLIRKISFWTATVLFLFFGIGVIAASQRNHYISEQHEAIVFAATVNIKSSPDENSKDIFVLHEGTKVTLMDNISDWQEIRISNGSIGWIKLKDLRKI